MSRYILIHRLRLPAVLLLIGVVALLHQAGLIDHFWNFFWPLLLILLGVLLLAERAALAAEGGYPAAPYPGSYPGQPGPVAPGVADYAAASGQSPESSSTVSAHREDSGNEPEGGQS
jgi:hypothetical protein